MSDPRGKRKWAGEPHREARQRDPGPLHLPPHKKPRKYRLTVRYERTTTEVCTKDFTTKDALREFRVRVEKEIAKEQAKQPRASWRSWWRWGNLHLKMDSQEHATFKQPPTITEELIDD